MKLNKSIFLLSFFLLVSLIFPGCNDFLDFTFRKTVDPDIGSITVSGIKKEIVIRRDELGIPVVEAKNFHDLVFATGYVMASDRLAQMTAFSLLGQGRLSEMVGKIALDIDVYVRMLGVANAAQEEFANLDDEVKEALLSFSAGVNSYINSHKNRLPLDFKLSGYFPEPWEPIDSLYISHVFNLGLSFNLHEEICFLNIAKTISPLKAAWLVPVYPDEPLSFDKARVLSKIDLSGLGKTTERLAELHQQFSHVMMPLGTAASNNWGIARKNTLKNASIIANDTHLPLEQPSLWMMIHLKAPELDAAGIAIAGVPGIVAGYNGHIAWGETMVMGDNQDVFLERLKEIKGKTHYLYKGDWHPVEERLETFSIKGEKDQERTIYSTIHGPLINSALKNKPKHLTLPPEIESPYGLALQSVVSHPGQSFNGMHRLMRAKNMKSAKKAIRDVRSMALNFIYSDKNRIAWQVSGRYPVRKSGRGHLPSPGWTGEYDWTGFVNIKKHPYVINPKSGYLYSANHRTVSPRKKPLLSSSWYSPERSERIKEMLKNSGKHTWKDSVKMHNDRYDPFVLKMQKTLFAPPLLMDINTAINSWDDEVKIARAKEAIDSLNSFDGKMMPDSKDAAIYGIFREIFIYNTFFDELGPVDTSAWQNFITMIQAIYPADQDHLLGRENSPFWDDLTTTAIENKAEVLAESFSETIYRAIELFGRHRSNWQWGDLLNYKWKTQTTQMKDFLPTMQKGAVSILGQYTDRGPYAAGGNYNTLNVAGFYKGQNFNVWLVPAMRMIVDFGLEEPMFLVNSSGQSGNPVSSHYDDGIPVWLNGETRSMPFKDENIKKQYDRLFVMKPKI